jgi:hypothetical protein
MSLFSVSSFLTYKKGLASELESDSIRTLPTSYFLFSSMRWGTGDHQQKNLAEFGCRLEREVDFSGTSLYFGNMLEPLI